MLLALRSPPFFPHSITAVLFETHYGTWIALLLLGAVALFLAHSKNNPKILRPGQLILAVTILWILAALLIKTPAERLYNAHLALADATAKADVDRILSYFAPTFTANAGPVQILDSTTAPQAKSAIADALKTYGIRGTSIHTYTYSTLTHTNATTYFSALTSGDYPILTTWQVYWEDIPNQDWRITQANLTKIGDQTITPDTFNVPSLHLP
jgi:hypothetical protein